VSSYYCVGMGLHAREGVDLILRFFNRPCNPSRDCACLNTIEFSWWIAKRCLLDESQDVILFVEWGWTLFIGFCGSAEPVDLPITDEV